MKTPTVSVVVVSRGRPDHLQICLRALFQVYYDPFEIVVVADPAGLKAIDQAGFSGCVKSAEFDEPNISKARNLGLTLAAGDVIAFLDDDSVPEPGWLFHLAGVFADPQVDAATGYVRGRNGISYQTTGQSISNLCEIRPVDVKGTSPAVLDGSAGQGISTIGTNCAFRREVFARLGGFDPMFTYYLDESDLNIRMANAGMATAIVPLAEVHHKTSASDQRTEKRLPKTLEQIGKSTTVFLRKHAPAQKIQGALEKAILAQRGRLDRHIKAGNCDSSDVEALLATMDDGIAEGLNATLSIIPVLPASNVPFLKLGSVDRKKPDLHKAISGRFRNRRSLRKQAVKLVKDGHVVSLFLLSRSALYHRVQFTRDGYWEQVGGQFGRSERTQPLFCAISLKKRAAKESQRVALVRHPWDIGLQ